MTPARSVPERPPRIPGPPGTGLSRHEALFWLVVLVALTGLGAAIARDARSAGRPALVAAAPIVAMAEQASTRIAGAFRETWPVALALSILPALLGIPALVRRRAEGWYDELFLLGLAAAATGAAALAPAGRRFGGLLLAAGVAALLVGARMQGGGSGGDPAATRASLRLVKICFLIVLVSAAFQRIYALDRIPSWDGETAFHMAASTDPGAAIRHAFRLDGRYISQGWLWYAIHGSAFAFLGPSLLTARLVYAASDLLLITLLFLLLRRLVSAPAALLGAGLAAFAPYALPWARTEYYFGLPALFGVILAWITWEADRERTPGLLALLAVTMGGSALLYPAGKALFLLPILFFSTRLARGEQGRRRVLTALLAGVFIYFLVPTALVSGASGRFVLENPLTPEQGENLWSAGRGKPLLERAGSLAGGIASNAGRIAAIVLVQAPETEYTPLVTVRPAALVGPVAALLALAGAAGVAARQGRDRESLALAWLAAAIPAALVTNVEARKLAAACPAVYLLAALGFDRVTAATARLSGPVVARGLASLALVATLGLSAVVRTGRYLPAPLVEPAAVSLARVIRPELERGTLLVSGLDTTHSDSSLGEKVFLELLGDVRLSGAIWSASLPDDTVDPEEILRTATSSPLYELTALPGALPGSAPPAIRKVTFVVLDHAEYRERMARIRARFPGARIERRAVGPDARCTIDIVRVAFPEQGVPPA